MSEEEGMQQDLEAKERRALECLMACPEEAADELAPMLGLSRQWQEMKSHAQPRLASVG